MGLRVLHERPSEFVTAQGSTFWLHDFRVQPTEAGDLDPDQVGSAFQDMFARVWRGEAENDGFNQLVLRAGLNWRQVEVLRTCCKYLLQIGIPFSQAYMEQTLVQNAGLITSTFSLPDGLTEGLTANDSTTTQIFVSGGAECRTYRIRNRIVTAGGRTLDKTIRIYVRER
jgi:glutamate dehydrogenase